MMKVVTNNIPLPTIMMRTQVLMRVKQRIVKKNQVMKKSPVIPVMKNQCYADQHGCEGHQYDIQIV